jgi:hypothetical protein
VVLPLRCSGHDIRGTVNVMQPPEGKRRPRLLAGIAGGLLGAAVKWAFDHINFIAWFLVFPHDAYYLYTMGEPVIFGGRLGEAVAYLAPGVFFGAIVFLMPLRTNRTLFWLGTVAGFLAAAFLGGHIPYVRE